MLDSLRFVATAVARKDYVPELTHFKITNGRVTGFNGVIALSSDIDVDLDIYPNASKLLAAIRACPGTIALNMTPAGKLAVRSEKFKSFVDCLPEDTGMFIEPDGEEVDLGPNFLPGLKALAPAMGIDASRPWAMGIRVQRRSMFATNNVMLAEYWHDTEVPVTVVIPAVAVNEILRINEAPSKVQVTDHSISFWFGPTRWLRSSLVETEGWPTDKMDAILSASTGEQLPFPDGFFDNVEKLKPFLNDSGTIFMTPTRISTSKDEGEGTSIEMELSSLTDMQAYHYKQLALLGELATKIDWTAYPRPCMFTGERLRGALVGQRV